MESPSPELAEPVILTWHSGSAYGALYDAQLNCHSEAELLEWVSRGIKFFVIDRETGKDVTRVFLAHWHEGRVIDPIGEADAQRMWS